MGDLIDRDAVLALFSDDENIPTQTARDAIADIPAVTVGVNPQDAIAKIAAIIAEDDPFIGVGPSAIAKAGRILAALEPVTPAPDAAADRIEALVRERDELRSWDDYFRKTCGYKRDGRSSPECLDEFIRGMNDTNRDAALSAALAALAKEKPHDRT